eukprot:CAMPEP_0171256548 /NCGR_PEP_ID=MMETSP0790-20130122/53365_1 /TAXON_ID=2925 /ORGANISM="Alexandrium catenella, Strain OF101" /LENGTH=30 /DNA_ID= /DNA_START= /DNA_END= /DNA_ORIENTATION=
MVADAAEGEDARPGSARAHRRALQPDVRRP